MVQAKKHFSQNFLHDKIVINQIVQAMNIQKKDKLLEVGPGTGALTKQLSLSCESLLALEIDEDLAKLLQEQFIQQRAIRILHQDAMTFSYDKEISYRLVSNLPYHLTTALIRQFISEREHIIDMHLMMQKEVAERLLCSYGKARGWLSVIIELLCEAEHLFDVPPESFQPMPAVQSSVVRFRWKKEESYSEQWLLSFQKLLMQAFSQKRKTLWNNFVKSRWKLKKEDWEKLNIDASLRAEQLSLDKYVKLHTYVMTFMDNDKRCN